MIAVRVVIKSKAAGNGKIMSMVIDVGVPAVRQQIKRGGIKRRRNWIARITAGKGNALQGKEFQVTAIKKLAAGIGKTNGPQAGTYGDVFAKPQASIGGAGEHRFSKG